MMRRLHRWPGLLAAAFLILLAGSGALLSVFPAVERVSAPAGVQGQTVADLATLVLERHPGAEQIRRAPSGRITVWWFDGGTPGAAVIDPATGQDVASADKGAVEAWLTAFHRSLLLDDGGRMMMAAAALAMLGLALSGSVLVARRVGGWRRWFRRLPGSGAGRLHTELARVAVIGLGLSAVTALWMAAATFDLLPVDEANPAFPASVSGQTGALPATIPTLRATPVAELRELAFPAPDDVGDVYTLTTGQGSGYLDRGTGALLVWARPGPWAQAYEWVYLLHTGQGAAIWGLILGLMALAVPVLAATGTILWVQSLRGRPRLRHMASAGRAETVILVGSEGGSTWGFAATLARALQAAGQPVHVAALSSLAPERYAAARRIVVMTATWGNGAAPSSARGALERLASCPPRSDVPIAVLGFGDNSFPEFCGFAAAFETAARKRGWSLLLPGACIDRQSPQAFARWGRAFGRTLGLPLELSHQPVIPRTTALTLTARRDYGEAVQAPAAILRFAVPQAGLRDRLGDRLAGRGFRRFRPGDLLGIVPQGASVPRFYSLASGHRDGFVEIAVRKHPGGLCSGQLMALQPGDSVQAFLRPNPAFQPDRGTAPLILIGAGTGIGPLAGFIRAQGARRPVHLWFGVRHPEADLLFGDELARWSAEGRLRGLHTAFSRSGPRQHVQDALREDAVALRALIARGARIMVCGGRDMAKGVQGALTEILAPTGLTPGALKSEGRYVEDIY